MFLYTIYSGISSVSTKCILQVYDFISPDPTAIPITNHINTAAQLCAQQIQRPHSEKLKVIFL